MVALSLMAGRVETGNAVLSPNGWHKSATISLVQTTPGGTKSIVRQRDFKWQLTPPGVEAAWARKTRLGSKGKSRKRAIEYVMNGTKRSKKQERRPAPPASSPPAVESQQLQPSTCQLFDAALLRARQAAAGAVGGGGAWEFIEAKLTVLGFNVGEELGRSATTEEMAVALEARFKAVSERALLGVRLAAELLPAADGLALMLSLRRAAEALEGLRA